MDDQTVCHVATCAEPRSYRGGEYLWRQGEAADALYLVLEGEINLEIHLPHLGPLMIDRIGAGEALGWSWQVSPYSWKLDARALTAARAIALRGESLRAMSEQNHTLGYELLKRLTPLISRRLDAARMRLLHLEPVASK